MDLSKFEIIQKIYLIHIYGYKTLFIICSVHLCKSVWHIGNEKSQFLKICRLKIHGDLNWFITQNKTICAFLSWNECPDTVQSFFVMCLKVGHVFFLKCPIQEMTMIIIFMYILCLSWFFIKKKILSSLWSPCSHIRHYNLFILDTRT